MKCTIQDCTGEYELRHVVHTVRSKGNVIVIDHVPAEVCNVCGDVLFTPETVRRIEQILTLEEQAIRTAPVYEFESAAT